MTVSIRLLFALLIPCLMTLCGDGSEVEFVVGGYMESEAGDWNPQESPLRNPFGVDFDSAGNMYVV
jgi:hypothetical protein